MLLFIKNFLSDLWDTISDFIKVYRYQIMGALVAVIILILLFGCAGGPASSQVAIDKAIISGESYVDWPAAPPCVAKDFLDDPGWGLMGGMTFVGKHGLPCHLLKIDRPVDGICDYAVIICETGETDERHGPDTPLFVTVGTIGCDDWDDMVETIKENF